MFAKPKITSWICFVIILQTYIHEKIGVLLKSSDVVINSVRPDNRQKLWKYVLILGKLYLYI